MKLTPFVLLFLTGVFAQAGVARGAEPAGRYFAIEFVDQETHRGVPLVELKTVSNVRFYTDSGGVAAIDDPALMGRTIFFLVSSDGYEFPADGFGMRGVHAEVRPGGTLSIKIKRLNIAQRLYRITGEGVYRDSMLLGRKPPVAEPLLNAQVTGQDSSQSAIYRGKIHWFWGDTMRQSYPLGHFGTAGALSDLPSAGGLNPDVGIDLKYFVSDDGFSRPMVPQPPQDPQWVDGVTVVKDSNGRERLLARVAIMKSVDRCVGRQLLIYNDPTDRFEKLADIPVEGSLQPAGHAVHVTRPDGEFVYFCDRFPDVRCRADLASFADVGSYEAFTCLAPGTSYAIGQSQLERDAKGKIVWGWKRKTEPLGREQIQELVKRGKLQADEVWYRPRDASTQKTPTLVAGSVAFNDYRQKWVMITSEINGDSSMLGEVWYSEADEPEGPWHWARKVITHNKYSFYNPTQDPFFDQGGGRFIYFEGTYSNTFSGNDYQTPRYDYNQIMYRLDLSDGRLKLPSD